MVPRAPEATLPLSGSLEYGIHGIPDSWSGLEYGIFLGMECVCVCVHVCACVCACVCCVLQADDDAERATILQKIVDALGSLQTKQPKELRHVTVLIQ